MGNMLDIKKGIIDVVLDTDTYNEIDDQFALAYMLRSKEKFNLKAVYAAPFFNDRSTSPKDGMEKSYAEIDKIMRLTGESVVSFRGSDAFLTDEKTPVVSDAVKDLIERSKEYSSEDPLYVVAIGAITNIASALILDGTLKNRIYVVWLGGHAHDYKDTAEFNMKQDVAAARVVMSSGVPFVQLPCMGVVSDFEFSKSEIASWRKAGNPLCEYLVDNTLAFCSEWSSWRKVIWDVVAVAYLLDGEERGFVKTKTIPVRLPSYMNIYEDSIDGTEIKYVCGLDKEKIFEDMANKILR